MTQQARSDELPPLGHCQVSVLKCWEPLRCCVPHWPRFQLFSVWDNGRNGFITEHNTWVLFNTVVVKVLIVVRLYTERCVFLFSEPPRVACCCPAFLGFTIKHASVIRSDFYQITHKKSLFKKSFNLEDTNGRKVPRVRLVRLKWSFFFLLLVPVLVFL